MERLVLWVIHTELDRIDSHEFIVVKLNTNRKIFTKNKNIKLQLF